MKTYLLAIDQGTTGSTALIVTLDGTVIGKRNIEFPQHFPQPGWVEHAPDDIWNSVGKAVRGAIEDSGIDDKRIAAIGITNQRETTLVWERASGSAIHRAIVWQDRRTFDVCQRLKAEGLSDRVRKVTGLVLDPYFSATKLAWMLDHTDGARARAMSGELAFGTVDSYLIHRLTGGAVHATDVTNASRTLLMDLTTRTWSPEMLSMFDVPREVLPTIVPSAGRHGVTKGVGFLPDGIPITGIAGDQQAALFGQACFREGDVKCTYGTGAFALMNIGSTPMVSNHGLITTVAWELDGKATYALEGSAFIAGAAVQWLRDGLGILSSSSEVEALAMQCESSEGVVFVPALAGLGAPHWNAEARGSITGLTRGTTRAHIARATLEGIAFQVWDLVHAMAADAGRSIEAFRIDGGASRNNLLAQFQADINNVSVVRPTEVESTGRGAAMLAGIGAQLNDLDATTKMVRTDRTFTPAMTEEERSAHLSRWRDAIRHHIPQ
jgi:glycerol kinase